MNFAQIGKFAFIRVVCVFMTAPPAALALDPQISFPRGGWNHAGLTDGSRQTAVAYPYNLIDRGAQRGRTLISGRLSALEKTEVPTLVINGNPMRLYAGENGDFARPYAFGPGSNSVELRSAQGKSLQRLQFYEANSTRVRAQIRAIVSWDDPQAEVDLHVLTPDGQHAFWAHPVLQGGGGMDVDSVDGAGPEIFSIAAAKRGPYQFYVNYWGNFGASGYHFDETRQKPIITCRITLILHENTPNERRESFVVPLRKLGELTHIRNLVF